MSLHVIAESKVGVSEQIGLFGDDIILDAEIPHIIIVLKTVHGDGVRNLVPSTKP